MPVPRQFANMSLQMFSPRRSVIIDMVMIQLISAIICALLLLVLKGDAISQTFDANHRDIRLLHDAQHHLFAHH